MRLLIVPFFTCFAGLGFLGNVWAQGTADRETMIHENVKLAEGAVRADIPADIAEQYRNVLPVFTRVLEKNTEDQPDEKRMLIRVEAGVREIGSAKTKRPLALVTASCRNSTREYVGRLILHSYLTDGPVNEQEIEEFLRIQILDPMECYVPTERVFGSPSVEEVTIPAVTEVKPTAAETPKSAAKTSPASAPAPTDRATGPPKAEPESVSVVQSDRGVDVHQNVRLIELAAPSDVPAEILDYYRSFLPMFNEVLRKNTIDQPEEKRMVIRVQAGVKEVGSTKAKRALAQVTASCRNTSRQYVGSLILYRYATDGPVNEEETEQFLRKQILEPSECYVPTEAVFSSPEPDR